MTLLGWCSRGGVIGGGAQDIGGSEAFLKAKEIQMILSQEWGLWGGNQVFTWDVVTEQDFMGPSQKKDSTHVLHLLLSIEKLLSKNKFN